MNRPYLRKQVFHWGQSDFIQQVTARAAKENKAGEGSVGWLGFSLGRGSEKASSRVHV